jgi:hypothetical protein
MNDEIERRLHQMTPRGAPAELRLRVLAAVDEPLRPVTPLPSRRSFRPALAVAIGVLASLALNFWVSDQLDRRLAIVLGPPPVRQQAAEIAADIASITDSATGQWVYERLAADQPDHDAARRYAVRLQQLIQQLTLDFKEFADESPQQNPQGDLDRRGSRDQHPDASQCLLRVEYRLRA